MANIPISSFTAAANATGIGMSGFSLTGSSAQSMLDLAGTWNTSGTPTGLKLNVTDTASNAASLLMDLQVGGATRMRVTKAGGLTLTGATANDTATFSSAGINIATNAVGLMFAVAESFVTAGTAVQVGALGSFSWRSTNRVDAGTADVILVRDAAAGTLAQRNGVNAQTFRVYNTFTDASNYERGFFRYASNVLEIGHEAAGTGSANRTIRFITSGFTALSIDAASMAPGVALVYPNATRMSNASFCAANNVPYGWSSTTNVLLAPDTTLVRVGAGLVGVRGTATTDGAALSLVEQTAPAAPATNGVYIYAEDNGSGKTRLMARFATGAAVQIAIEP